MPVSALTENLKNSNGTNNTSSPNVDFSEPQPESLTRTVSRSVTKSNLSFSFGTSPEHARNSRPSFHGSDSSPFLTRTMTGAPAKKLQPFRESDIKILLLENVNKTGQDILREQGYQVEAIKSSLPEDQLIEKIRDVHVLGIRSKTKLNARVLAAAKNLIVVGCFCIGTNQVDLKYAADHGICVFNSPFSNSRSVAELVIGEIISLARQLGDRSNEMHRGTWNKVSSRCWEVRGKTLGIVGYGHIGSQLSVLAEAMGMKVIYYDVTNLMSMGTAHQVSSLNELLKGADFVTLHVPELPETKNMISTAQFEQMKQGSYLINASRGSVVDIPALIDASRSGKVAGAALDVYPAEPAGNGDYFTNDLNSWAEDLRSLKNIILTPHIGGSTEEAQSAIGIEVAESLVRYVNEGVTVGAVNMPEVTLRSLTINDSDHARVIFIHQNVPGVLGRVNKVLSDHNVDKQMSDSRGDMAYMMADVSNVRQAEIETLYKDLEGLKERINGQLVLGDQQVDREGESASSTHIKRSYNGLEVIFGSGAEVQTVTLIQDFSSVNISGLEANTTKAAVQDLLEKYGQNVQDAVIKITPTNGGVVARITVRDPAFSSNILQKFGNDLDLIPSNHEIRIQKVQPELKSGTSAQRVNCRSVSCSWHKPTHTVSLDFGGTEQQLARHVMNKFNNGFYEFSGQRVKTVANLTGRTGFVRPFTRPPLWRVVLSNVPGEVLEADIRRMLGDKEKPESCRLGEPSYTLSPHAAAEKIRKRLLEWGPLEEFQMKHDPSSKRYKATATFTEDSDATTACAALNDQPLPFGNGKLSIELNVTAKLKVLTKVYDAVKIEIGSLYDECTNNSNVRFNFYRPTQPPQRLTTIKVSGADASDVATVKNKLDTILSGRLVRDNEGCNVWHTALIGETGSQLISELETRFKVVILREITTSTVRLYGTMDDCEACSHALRKLAAVSEDDLHEIPLDSDAFSNIMKGSYSMLRARLGMQNVSLKVSSASKKIVIKGSEREPLMHSLDIRTMIALSAGRLLKSQSSLIAVMSIVRIASN
ncbi:D-3-phosphoglycerate dehydrogenase 2 [Lithohypha guttulata]|uniref:phosphoglycerate dehydrogenase n=1 Tax=Lithohypha guttulata TaxID=1690604 RepID=A0AAN7Y8N2_9EURO|nr:D-3-phosphoglycerate dehydrogenase 2 [Lithohypha guttulata]